MEEKAFRLYLQRRRAEDSSMMQGHLRLLTDGTPEGTKVFAPDGTEIAIIAVELLTIKQDSIGEARITCYVQSSKLANAEESVSARSLPKPNLGCATTRELLEELIARAQLGGHINYRPATN